MDSGPSYRLNIVKLRNSGILRDPGLAHIGQDRVRNMCEALGIKVSVNVRFVVRFKVRIG